MCEYVKDYKFYPFSIITTITPNNRAYTDIPKVIIKVNEIIVGNVDIAENERINQFYEVWLTYDSYRVDFDFQSEVAGLYVNLGGTRPTTRNADFKLLPSGRDSILSIDKLSIIQKAFAKKIKIPNENSLQDLNLVIGIWTNKTDSINTEVFSLCVRLPSKDTTLDIYEINTDHKILCSPKYLSNNQFNCLYMITYDDKDVEKDIPLLFHAASVNQSTVTNFYGNFIEREYYDEYDVENLRRMIPTPENAQFNSEKESKEYFYTNLRQSESKKYYLFINVISDKEDDIFILTSMPEYNINGNGFFEFYPNSIKEKLLSVSEGKKLNLKFYINSGIIVNFVTLGGEAEIKWVNDPNHIYKLRGNGDRLTLTAGFRFNEILIENVKSLNSKLSSSNEPGFVFYISYYERNTGFNFDKINYGKSLEIGYKQTFFPIYLYSKIGNCYNDINIAITFKDLDLNTNGEYDSSYLSLIAGVISEDLIYKIKEIPIFQPIWKYSVFGDFDPALKTGQFFLSSYIIKNFKTSWGNNPALYIYLDNNSIKQESINFSIEAQITEINSGVVPVENIYHYGRYYQDFINYYKLKKNKNKDYMILEISFNSDYLDFSLNQETVRTNLTDLIKDAIKERGRIIITIKTTIIQSDFIYLNIFRKNESNNILYNYVFKYSNVENENEFLDYKILDNNNNLTIQEITENDNNFIECSFNRIDIEKNKANITYYFKIIHNETYLRGESYESIALMKSPYYTVFERNPSDNNGKITLKGNLNYANIAYLQVIAQIEEENNIEYISYRGMKYSKINPEPEEEEENEEEEDDTEKEEENRDGKDEKKDNNSKKGYIITICTLSSVIAILLAFIIFIICRKKTISNDKENKTNFIEFGLL